MSDNTVTKPKGRPFSISSIIIALVGIIPLLIFFFTIIMHIESVDSYYGGGQHLIVIIMGFIGFVVHGIGMICGIVGFFMRSWLMGFLGFLGNATILILIISSGLFGLAFK